VIQGDMNAFERGHTERNERGVRNKECSNHNADNGEEFDAPPSVLNKSARILVGFRSDKNQSKQDMENLLYY
jgi:hypothetical protein